MAKMDISPKDIAKVKISRLVSLGLGGSKLRKELDPILIELVEATKEAREARIKKLEEEVSKYRQLKQLLK